MPTVDHFLNTLRDRIVTFYGDRLVSLAVFGSHASGRAHRRSDLDLFIVLTTAAARRRLRLEEFDRVETSLEPAMDQLAAEGWSLDLSPVIRTREEAEGFSILYLDMTVDVRILVDHDDSLRRRLDHMRIELHRLGAERRTLGRRWYWILKKDYRPGEIFEIR
jgi:predicted nucleotidyltransferase